MFACFKTPIFWGPLFALIIFGCSEGGRGLKNGVTTRHDINASRSECEKVDFHHNTLRKKNILLGMKCLGLDNRYFLAEDLIEKSSAPQFNKLMLPFNTAFFGGTRGRSEAVDFFSSKVQERTKTEIQSIASNSPKVIKDFKLFTKLKDLNAQGKAFIPSKGALTQLNEFYRLSKKTANDRSRIGAFISELVEKDRIFLGGLSSEVIVNLLSKASRDQFKLFLDGLTLLDRENHLGPEDFEKILKFFAWLQPKDIETLGLFKAYLDGSRSLSCMGEIGLELDVRKEFYQQVLALENGDQGFYSRLNSLFIKVKYLESLCNEQAETEVFRDVMRLTGNFFSMEGSTALARAYTNTRADKTDIFNFLQGNFFFELNHFLKSLGDESLSELSKLMAQYVGAYDLAAKKSYAAGIGLLNHPEVRNLLEALNKEKGFANYFLLNFIAHKGAQNSSALILEMLEKWPNLHSDLVATFSGPEVYDLLIYWEDRLTEEATFQNVKEFALSEDMTRFFNLFLGEKKPLETSENNGGAFSASERPLVFLDEASKENTLRCLKDLTSAIDERELLSFVNQYTDSCKDSLQEDMASKLLVYAGQSNAAFKSLFNKDLFMASGVFSPEFLNLYVSSLALYADLAGVKSVAETQRELVKFRKAILGPSFLANTLDTFKLIERSEAAQRVVESSLLYVGQMRPNNLQTVLGKLVSDPPPYADIKIPAPTVAATRTLNQVNETPFSAIADRKLLVENFIDFIDPRVGTKIGPSDEVYRFNIKEALLFLYDLTDPKYVKNVYHYKSGIDVAYIPMRLSERLETTIWDISFLNNFYGAYFINRIGNAESYSTEVKKLRRNIRTLDLGEGLLRRMGVYPQKTLWAFKNIYNAYNSLEEIGESQFGPEKRSYAKTVQAFLKRLVLSSPERSRSFSPYRKPDPELVQGHAGALLSRAVNQGLLTKLSLFLRENYSESFNVRLDTKEFSNFKKEFESIDFKKLRPLLIRLAQNKKVFKLAQEVLKDFARLSPIHQELVLSRGVNILASFLNLAPKDQNGIVYLIQSTLNQVNLKEQIDLVQLAEVADKYLDVLSHLPGLADSLHINASNMIQSEKVLSGLGIPSFKNELMKAIIESPHFPTHSVIETLKRHYRENGHFHYFLDLLKLLSIENDGRSNLEVSIRSVFVESETELSVFLSDIIQKISIKPSYTLSE